MADNPEEQAPPQETAQRGGLAEQWKKLATWQKAGVLIGGGALIVAILIYINGQREPTATGNDQMAMGLPAGTPAGTQPGGGDQFPPVPVTPVTPVSTPLPGPVRTPGPINNPKPIATNQNYTIRGGDTLSGIAATHGETWQQLYAKNKTVIDTTAKQHGKTSNFPSWIFPGEQIVL